MALDLIKPMNLTLVRDAICQLLATERDAQKEAARSQGLSEAEIDNQIDFTIYPKKLSLPDLSGMPAVFVYFNQIKFPADEQDIYESYAQANLQIEFYTLGKTEIGKDESGRDYIIKTAEENAEDRLNYLTAQIYKILCCEKNVTKGTENIVTHSLITNWERIKSPEDENAAVCVLGAAITMELGFNEPTSYVETVKIEEFYLKLNIQEQYIDPFVRIILDKNKTIGENS